MLPMCLGCLWLQMWLELVFEPRRHQPTTGNANKLLKINWDKRDPERTNFPKLVSGIWSTVYQEIMWTAVGFQAALRSLPNPLGTEPGWWKPVKKQESKKPGFSIFFLPLEFTFEEQWAEWTDNQKVDGETVSFTNPEGNVCLYKTLVTGALILCNDLSLVWGKRGLAVWIYMETYKIHSVSGPTTPSCNTCHLLYFLNRITNLVHS